MSKIRIKGDTSGFVDLETSTTGSNLSVTGNSVHIPGHVMQVKRASVGGNISTSSSTPVASGVQCSITPKYSTSLIKIELIGGRSYISANQQLDVSLYKDGSNINTTGAGRWESIYSNGTDAHYGGFSACWFETAGSTAARTYELYFDVGTGTGYLNNSPGGGNEYLIHLVATEIAQ